MDCGSPLDLFFNPSSIAIIGISRKAVDSSVSILTTIKDFGFKGQIYIVNPKLPATCGLKIFPDLASIKKPIDLAIISLSRARVLNALKECIKNNIMASIVITQGFADADDEGKRLQSEMAALNKDNGIRILGPNTMGVMNAFANFTSSFFEVSNEKLSFGLIAQSGLFMMGYHMMSDVHAGFGMAMDLGNACDINCSDVLRYYEDEINIKVIQTHLEALGDGREFLKSASRVSSKKPLVVLKSRKTKTGKRAVISHSGAAAGENEVYEAAFKKCGAVTAKNTEELRLLSKAFLTYRPMKDKRIAIVSFSGAAAILAVDAIEGAELTLAEFSDSTIVKLKELFPPWMKVGNPLDIWIAVSSNDFHATYPKILEHVLKDNNVDVVICIYIFFTLPKHEEYNSSIHIRELSKKYPEKPMLCWSYGLDVSGFSKKLEKDGSVLVFPSLESAARTLKKLNEYHKYRRSYGMAYKYVKFQADEEKIYSILSKCKRENEQHLFVNCLGILKAYNNRVAKWVVAREQSELKNMPNKLAFPVAMKIVSPHIIHKSDLGGIRLDIASPEELKRRDEEMLKEIKRKVPDASVSGH